MPNKYPLMMVGLSFVVGYVLAGIVGDVMAGSPPSCIEIAILIPALLVMICVPDPGGRAEDDHTQL